MKHLLLCVMLLACAIFALPHRASAEVIPSVKGLKPFTIQAKFMSLPGLMRWQYHKENKVWISIAEAAELVKSQQ